MGSKSNGQISHSKVLPEALEKWSLAVMKKRLPRHVEIIDEIDKQFIALLRATRSDLETKIPNLCIVDSSNPQKSVVRMANLCAVTADTVNGVAQLHSDILKAEFLADYVSIWPTKFQNKTNGVTPRRWLSFCNPELCSIITKWLKTDGWLTNLDLLTNLRQFADNEELQAEWATAKRANTKRLAQYELQVTGLSIDPKSLFDIQVKRIHEYKRQLLNILGAIYRYKTLKLSLGDARAYYLSTAKNELGVVSAESIGGATMVPISWTEMQCSLTGQIEQRKVAKGGV